MLRKKWKIKCSLIIHMHTPMYEHKWTHKHYPFVTCHWQTENYDPGQQDLHVELCKPFYCYNQVFLIFSHSAGLLPHKLSTPVGASQVKATEMQGFKICGRILAGLLQCHCRFYSSYKTTTPSSPVHRAQLCCLIAGGVILSEQAVGKKER